MRHGFIKVKFGHGHDANQMLKRKLAVNFLKWGKIETTFSKVKVLKPIIEKMVTKIKGGTEADHNQLLKQLGSHEQLLENFKEIKTAMSKINSGFVKIIKLGARESDGGQMARLIWAYPVVNAGAAAAVKKSAVVKDEKKLEVKKTK